VILSTRRKELPGQRDIMLTFANEQASRLFSRLTIRTKTFIASAVVLSCLLTMGVIAVYRLARGRAQSQ
jgi:hypothetical protein